MSGRSISFAVATAVLLLGACSRHLPDAARRRPLDDDTAHMHADATKLPPAAPPSTSPADPQPPGTPAEATPPGYRSMAVGGLAPTADGNAVVLMDETARRGLVLYIAGTEALSIALRLEHKKFARPLTHDLLDNVVRKLGADVVGVRVDRIENDIYYGSVLLAKGDGRFFELDARPSDALALAIGNGVPVFVADAVLEQAGVDVDKFDFRKLREPPTKGASDRDEVAL